MIWDHSHLPNQAFQVKIVLRLLHMRLLLLMVLPATGQSSIETMLMTHSPFYVKFHNADCSRISYWMTKKSFLKVNPPWSLQIIFSFTGSILLSINSILRNYRISRISRIFFSWKSKDCNMCGNRSLVFLHFASA